MKLFTTTVNICIFTCLVTLLTGCGDDLGPVGSVTGNVILPGGESPAGCIVVFMNEESGTGASATVEEDGTYTLKYKGGNDVPVGVYQVAVKPPSSEMSEAEYEALMNATPAEQKKMNAERKAKEAVISEKYRNTQTSGLSFEIKSGDQNYDVNLTE